MSSPNIRTPTCSTVAELWRCWPQLQQPRFACVHPADNTFSHCGIRFPTRSLFGSNNLQNNRNEITEPQKTYKFLIKRWHFLNHTIHKMAEGESHCITHDSSQPDLKVDNGTWLGYQWSAKQHRGGFERGKQCRQLRLLIHIRRKQFRKSETTVLKWEFTKGRNYEYLG